MILFYTDLDKSTDLFTKFCDVTPEVQLPMWSQQQLRLRKNSTIEAAKRDIDSSDADRRTDCNILWNQDPIGAVYIGSHQSHTPHRSWLQTRILVHRGASSFMAMTWSCPMAESTLRVRGLPASNACWISRPKLSGKSGSLTSSRQLPSSSINER